MSSHINDSGKLMPKNLSLFGRYIRHQAKSCRLTFRKYQITKLIPNKAAGRVPSASSQMGLYHNDDFNGYWKLSAFNTMYRKRTKPFVVNKDFVSDKLNSKVSDMRVTPSALYGIDDKGGFDEYVLRTPPEEMRSNTAEKLRSVMYYFMEHPDIKSWGMPWKTFLRKRDRADPWYARYRTSLVRADRHKKLDVGHSRFSPYYLPKDPADLYPQRDVFINKQNAPRLNLWWKETTRLQDAFRKRLGEAKSFEEAHPDHRDPGAYRKGGGAGGGGGQGSPRPRSKTYRARQIRSY
jgi:large subunit ribosomal protein L28